MTRGKTGDPRDRERRTGGARFVPLAAGYGTEAIVPAPLDCGPPQPEPEERWTLFRGSRSDRSREGDEASDLTTVPAEPDGAACHADVPRSGAEKPLIGPAPAPACLTPAICGRFVQKTSVPELAELFEAALEVTTLV